MSRMSFDDSREIEGKRKIKELSLLSVIGFSGGVNHGLHAPNTGELVFPVGNYIALWSWTTSAKSKKSHALLKGHNSKVAALAVSANGDIVVSAENGISTEWATVIVWSLSRREEIGRHSAHREEIVAVGVSSDGKFIFSLGGETDGKLIVWDLEAKKPVCSIQACEAGAGEPKIMRSAPITPTLLGVSGRRIMKIFSYDEKNQKFSSAHVNFGLIVRHYTDLQIDSNEEFLYGSTSTGDIVKVKLNLENGKVSSVVPILVALMAPKPFTKGVGKGVIREALPAMVALCILLNGDIIVGDSSGTVRGFTQDTFTSTKKDSSRAKSGKALNEMSAPTRAHGSIKIVRPRDPSSPMLKQVWSLQVNSSVTSLCMEGESLLVGTDESAIFEIHLGSPERFPEIEILNRNRHRVNKNLQQNKCSDNDGSGGVESLLNHTPPSRLLSTCSAGAVYDIAFPSDVGDLVVTAGDFGIRVWNVRSLQELLNVSLPGIICKCCAVSPDLSVIISGWIDGRIRGVGAESGSLKWTIEDAHHKSVNSITCLGSDFVISGGADGRVRSWQLSTNCRPSLFSSAREHRGEVTYIKMNSSETQLLSCGGDGLCILWKTPALERLHCLKADTVFLGGSILVRDEIVTVGSDGCVSVWDATDGTLLTDLKINRRPVTAVDVTKDDKLLVTLVECGTVKIWNWEKGRVIYEGVGHSGANSSAKFSPDGEIIVSAGVDGCILIWKTPKIKGR